MGNFSTNLNAPAITAAAEYVNFLNRIISATLDELHYQLDQYYDQRSLLARNEGPDYRATKLKFYAQEWPVEGTDWNCQYIYWGWSVWMGEKYTTRHISSENRKTGAYSKTVLRKAIKANMGRKAIAPWELLLAYTFEVERLQPLRQQLRVINNLLAVIRRVPYTPSLQDGHVSFDGLPMHIE